MDLEVLQLLGTSENWERYGGLINPDHLAPESRKLFKELGHYYETHNVGALDWREFQQWLKLARMPQGKQASVYDHILNKLAGAEVEAGGLSQSRPGDAGQAGALGSALGSALRDRYYATQIAEVALRVADNDPQAKLDDVGTLLACRDREAGASSATVALDMDELLSTTHGDGGLQWRLAELNISLGRIRTGDFVCLGARPEAGKSTWLAQEATHMAAQIPAGQHVVWFNNEEQGSKVKLRCIQAALGATQAQIAAHAERAKAKYVELVGAWDKIIIVDSPHITAGMIEGTLKRYPPGLIVFDQLRKVRGFSKAERNDVQRLAVLYQYGRRLAKQYAPVLTVHQAGGSAAGVLYPSDDMLEGCRTEIQGELDVQIMMGRREPDDGCRGLNIVKNKLPSPGDEGRRHAMWEVRIQPEIARFHSGASAS